MCFSSKTSSGHEEWSSEKHTGNFLSKVQEFFCSKDDKVSLKAREVLWNHAFFLNFFSSKSSTGHAECTFGKPCRNLFAQFLIFFTQSTKLLKNHLFSFFFSQNFFSGHVDWSFGNPAVMFRQKSAMILLKVPKDMKNYLFSMKSPQNVPLDTPKAVWTTPAKLLCPKLKKFCLKNKNY